MIDRGIYFGSFEGDGSSMAVSSVLAWSGERSFRLDVHEPSGSQNIMGIL